MVTGPAALAFVTLLSGPAFAQRRYSNQDQSPATRQWLVAVGNGEKGRR
jgi:hypothetical protein